MAGVGGDSQGCAANDGGGDVQQTTPGTLGSVGYRLDGQRVAAVDDGGGSGGGGCGGGGCGGGGCGGGGRGERLLFMVSGVVGGGSKDKNLIPS